MQDYDAEWLDSELELQRSTGQLEEIAFEVGVGLAEAEYDEPEIDHSGKDAFLDAFAREVLLLFAPYDVDWRVFIRNWLEDHLTQSILSSYKAGWYQGSITGELSTQG